MKTMKTAYPITITKDGKYYVVYVPDFDVNTEGTSIADAMEMARDVIGMTGCYLQDEGRELPHASELDDIVTPEGGMKTLVDVDFDAYRRKHEKRTVRKNVSLPSWLNEAAEAANINFSAVLQGALKDALDIRD